MGLERKRGGCTWGTGILTLDQAKQNPNPEKARREGALFDGDDDTRKTKSRLAFFLAFKVFERKGKKRPFDIYTDAIEN